MNLMLIPPPPRIPSRRARELIFKYQGGQKVLLLVGAVFLGLGVVLCVPLTWGLPADVLLDLGAKQTVMAQVLDQQLDTNTQINGENPIKISYRYSLGGGSYTGNTSTRDRALIAAAAPGAQVPIEVYAPDPSWARLRGTHYSLFGYLGLFILLFPVAGAVMLGLAVRWNRREIRAFVNGKAIMARVVFKGEDTAYEINGRYPFKIAWEFRPAGPEGPKGRSDRSYSGSISSMSFPMLEDLAKLDHVPVLYDPQDPSINTVYVS